MRRLELHASNLSKKTQYHAMLARKNVVTRSHTEKRMRTLFHAFPPHAEPCFLKKTCGITSSRPCLNPTRFFLLCSMHCWCEVSAIVIPPKIYRVRLHLNPPHYHIPFFRRFWFVDIEEPIHAKYHFILLSNAISGQWNCQQRILQ